MPPRKKPSAPFPGKEELLAFIKGNPGKAGKREIARAFHLDAGQKILLKRALRDLREDGLIAPSGKRRYHKAGTLPAVAVVEITGTDADGEVLAKPLAWENEAPAPVIYMAPERRGGPAPGPGDRILARLQPTGEGAYEGRTIRRLPSAPTRVLGILEKDGDRFRLRPTDRRAKNDFTIDKQDAGDAQPGDLVRAEPLPGRRLGPRRARVIECLSKSDGSRSIGASISLIAIHDYDIPTDFSAEALAQAEAAGPAPLDHREDLRRIPLVTIDGADARDFDDAVWAEPDPENSGGWRLMVAIADVSWYVRPGSPLDADAYPRGNSVYFPDRVVPMLPEALSNGWCSLKPKEERPCLAVYLRIDKDGNLLDHRFLRGLMKSVARLTYEQVQAAQDGHGDEIAGPIGTSVIAPLYGAYEALERNRKARGVLDLDLPERKVVVDKKGEVVRIETRARLDSHKLIEEFMITANVAAAKELEKRRLPCMYRIHDEPSMDKMENLRQFLGSLDIPFAKGGRIEPKQFNRILKNAAGTPYAQMINDVVLRSQSQAEYNPDNIGHFGLALTHYCHFTSPIRRYSDLLVHRALISGLKLGEDGLEKNHRDFTEMGEHLSQTERRAAGAERSAVDRFTAAYLSERVGAQFPGRINGATRFGLFVTLDGVGGDGLIPMRSLPDDYYIHEEALHLLRGRNTGREFRLGDPIDVILSEANPVTGGMIFALAGEEGSSIPDRTRGKPGRRRKKGAKKRGKVKKRTR